MVAESGRNLKIVIVKENRRDWQIVSDSKGLDQERELKSKEEKVEKRGREIKESRRQEERGWERK